MTKHQYATMLDIQAKKITDADADFLNSLQARSATGKSRLTNQRRI